MPPVRRTPRMSARRRGDIRILLAGSAALFVAACGEKNVFVPPPPPKVIVAQPLKQPVTRYIEFTGTTQPVNNVDLEARVQGFLEGIHYTDGQLMKKDARLFTIQRNTYEAQLMQAKATLASNQAAQLNAQGEYTRKSNLGR